ncbi:MULTISPECIES: MMPL family transporter [Thermomonosporaceae]|uniref:MMPL family transporter n=1 Tax=Thermomonosporaceae TaxID=2012 RepID=UPI00255B36CE|nr:MULTISPECIES: MMPL family transporter [Thermomonosporaceae]MDL4772295.1 MMPL family transporter [Actinomadura xylanilytica]
MFARLGRGVVRHPWWTILAWIVVAAGLIAFAPELKSSSDQEDFLPSKYESIQAGKLAATAFPSADQKTSPAMIVVKRKDGGKLTPADQKKVAGVAAALQAKKIPGVTKVAATPAAKDGSIQLIAAPLPNDYTDTKAMDTAKDAIKKLRTESTAQLRGSPLTFGVTGDMASTVDNEKSDQQTMALIGIATIALIIVLLGIIFRSPLASILPIIVVLAVSMVSNAVTAMVGNAFGLNFDKGFDMIVMIVLYGIGTDYILFLLFRYRERLRLGEDKKTAMINSVERVGEAIASAAGAVIVAFLVLLLASFKAFGGLGPQLAIAVGVMLVTSLTLVPAVVSLLGQVVFWPSKAWKKEPKPGLWVKLGNAVGRRPLVAAVSSGLVLIALATATLGFKADYDFSASAPQNTESAKAMNDLKNSFPAGTLTPTEVYVKADRPLTAAELAPYGQRLTKAPGVGDVQPPLFSQDKTVAKYNVVLKDNPNSSTSISLVKGPLRDFVHQGAPAGAKVLVGGQTAVFADINTINNRDLSVILPVAVLLIGVILALLLRAVVAPIYLVGAVLLGFAATLGATVTVFQGIEGKPGLMFQLPIILYLFVLAIGTDYNILMIARLREEAREGHDPRRGTALGIQHAGPTVAAAGVILAGTFGVLMISPQSMLAQIGFGVAIGILLSAFVMSAFFVPAITALLGHKAWWPGHGDAPKAQPPKPEALEDDRFATSGRPS